MYHCISCLALRPKTGWKKAGWKIHKMVDEHLSETTGKVHRFRFDGCPACEADKKINVEVDCHDTMEQERSLYMIKNYSTDL